jgi:predicted SAM-dependent methyltransferase
MGCANGGQLKVLKGRGFTNLTGVDPSKNCVNNVMKSGIDAFQTQIFDHVFFSWDKKFDLIILSHVLEHIRDLGDAIQIVKSKLTKKGLIYIEVPDASRYNKFYVVPYYYIDYEHINHFSKNSLNYLMQQFGFKSIETNQGEIKLNKQNEYPYFYSLFSLTNTQNVQICYDNSVLESFNSFLIQSKINNNLDIMLQMLVSSQTEVIVWGAGQFALRLLATSSLSKANIIGFVDSDISKRNKKIDKYQVYSPEFIVDKNACLIICSALYSDEILKSAFQLNKDIKYIVLK